MEKEKKHQFFVQGEIHNVLVIKNVDDVFDKAESVGSVLLVATCLTETDAIFMSGEVAMTLDHGDRIVIQSIYENGICENKVMVIEIESIN